MKSIGMIEVSGVTGAIDCLDIMCKSADVELVTWERKLGGRLVTVVVQGDVSAVTAAEANFANFFSDKRKSKLVIVSPHHSICFQFLFYYIHVAWRNPKQHLCLV